MVKDHIKSKLQAALERMQIEGNILVDNSSSMNFGDYSSNIAMQLTKTLKKNPMLIVEEIAKNIQADDVIEKVEVAKPGFINFWINKKKLRDNLDIIINHGEKYGKTLQNNGKKVIVEFSSPNIAKPFTVGHLRSTIIGDAVAKLLESTGWKVYRDNHLGDWGTQFGKQIYAIKTWGNEEELNNAENPVKILVDLYVKFHSEAEKNSDIEEEGRKWFKKLEDGDVEARRLWKKCIEWSWKEFNKIYDKLGVIFTENNGHGYGESFFEDKMKPVIEELRQKNLLKESKGAQLVFFPEDKYPPLMILKNDGATLYSTRDLATDKFRLEHYGKDIMVINEVGAEQTMYFRQLYMTENLLGWYKPEQRVHIAHGLYRFKDEKMSTRKGNVIWLEDVLDQAIDRAQKLSSDESINLNYEESSVIEKKSEINKKNKFSHLMNYDEKEAIGTQVGIGALKWNDLKRTASQDIVFDWNDILNMQGDSGPYMQYTYVRCKSVIKDQSISKSTYETYNSEELTILRLLSLYSETVLAAAQQFAPNIICNYLFRLAQEFNLFYQKHSILKADEETKKFRIILTHSVAQIIQNGLNLLGIQTVEKM